MTVLPPSSGFSAASRARLSKNVLELKPYYEDLLAEFFPAQLVW